MERNERIVLDEFKSKSRINKDIILKQYFENSANVLPIEPIYYELDIPTYFSKERNEASIYRFLGNFNIVASNVLFNWDGDDSYQTILEKMDYDFDPGDPQSTEEYTFTQDEILKEKNGWFYYLGTGDTNCDKIFLEPKPERFSTLNLSGDTNWDVYLTYPSEKDVVSLEFNGVPLSEGIAIYSGTTVIIDSRPMTALICSINHGLSIGDEIVIRSTTANGYEGIFNVYGLGFGDGTYKTNTFILDYVIPGGLTPTTFTGTETRFKKRINNRESEYYTRWFRKISKKNDLDLHYTAFSNNIYKDSIFSYTFKKEVDLGLYRDHLNRPLTELYITLIKNNDNQFWTNIQSGLNTVIYNSEYDINTLNTINNNSIENNLNINLDTFFGDIVEYNELSQNEIILEVAYHRFNTENREDNNFLEGYYYKPHYKQQIKKFSNYVNTIFESDDYPDYATVLQDGRIIWRDILSNDFSNSDTIPFLNGCHYIYDNLRVFVRRQDPCDLYNMPNKNFVPGICETNEQFTFNTPQNDFCE